MENTLNRNKDSTKTYESFYDLNNPHQSSNVYKDAHVNLQQPSWRSVYVVSALEEIHFHALPTEYHALWLSEMIHKVIHDE